MSRSSLCFLASVTTLCVFLFGMYVASQVVRDAALSMVLVNLFCALFALHLVAVFAWLLSPRSPAVRRG